MSICYTTIASPIGPLMITADSAGLTGLYFSQGKKSKQRPDPSWREDSSPFQQAANQLEEYFAGQRQQFDLPLHLQTSPFQQRVLAALQAIPFGETRTYKQIAEAIGSPKAMRAVGMANGNNPLAIFIPCHRVVGSDGSLTGFGGGLEAKRYLLALEGAI
jgi:methylated-DNA-[protein]-cysteine S-methyltransferase